MSDQNAFINNYIDVIIGTTHEQLSSIFQLKTKLKMTDDLIREKDGIISSLETELESTKKSNEINSVENNSLSSEIEIHKTNAKIWEESYTAMKNKVSHMDTMANQLNEFKQQILVKNNEIDRLNKEILTLKGKNKAKEPVKLPEEKEINSKSKLVKEEITEVPVSLEKKKTTTLDDF